MLVPETKKKDLAVHVTTAKVVTTSEDPERFSSSAACHEAHGTADVAANSGQTTSRRRWGMNGEAGAGARHELRSRSRSRSTGVD